MTEHSFGEILRNERKKQGISRKKLSEMTGFTVRAISYWETNKRDIALKNADVVALALNITICLGKGGDIKCKQSNQKELSI